MQHKIIVILPHTQFATFVLCVIIYLSERQPLYGNEWFLIWIFIPILTPLLIHAGNARNLSCVSCCTTYHLNSEPIWTGNVRVHRHLAEGVGDGQSWLVAGSPHHIHFGTYPIPYTNVAEWTRMTGKWELEYSRGQLAAWAPRTSGSMREQCPPPITPSGNLCSHLSTSFTSTYSHELGGMGMAFIMFWAHAVAYIYSHTIHVFILIICL